MYGGGRSVEVPIVEADLLEVWAVLYYLSERGRRRRLKALVSMPRLGLGLHELESQRGNGTVAVTDLQSS